MTAPLLRPLLVAVLAALLGACSSTPKPKVVPSPYPVGDWTVETIREVPALEGDGANLRFHEDGSLSGSTGVNAMSASWEVLGPDLELSEIAMTRRAGRPELMEQETRLLEALGEARRIEVDGDMLRLTDEMGRSLITARRRA